MDVQPGTFRELRRGGLRRARVHDALLVREQQRRLVPDEQAPDIRVRAGCCSGCSCERTGPAGRAPGGDPRPRLRDPAGPGLRAVRGGGCFPPPALGLLPKAPAVAGVPASKIARPRGPVGDLRAPAGAAAERLRRLPPRGDLPAGGGPEDPWLPEAPLGAPGARRVAAPPVRKL